MPVHEGREATDEEARRGYVASEAIMAALAIMLPLSEAASAVMLTLARLPSPVVFFGG